MAVNVLTNSLKIFMSLGETYSKSIGFAVINKYDEGDFVSISAVFGRFTKGSKGPLKLHFLDNYLPTFFGVRNFGNTSAMRVIFLKKMFKI